MKLDQDLVREILLAVEASDHSPYTTMALAFEAWIPQEVSYHVMLLHEAGLVKGKDVSVLADTFPVWEPMRLTHNGHEFLETVRDSEVWRRTKNGAEKAGVAGFSVLLDLGKAYGKQVLKERLGIELP